MRRTTTSRPALALLLVAAAGMTTVGCSAKQETAVIDGGGPTTVAGPTTTKNPAYKEFCTEFMKNVIQVQAPNESRLAEYKQVFAKLEAAAPAPVVADLKAFNTYIQAQTSAAGLKQDAIPAPVKLSLTNTVGWMQQNCDFSTAPPSAG